MPTSSTRRFAAWLAIGAAVGLLSPLPEIGGARAALPMGAIAAGVGSAALWLLLAVPLALAATASDVGPGELRPVPPRPSTPGARYHSARGLGARPPLGLHRVPGLSRLVRIASGTPAPPRSAPRHPVEEANRSADVEPERAVVTVLFTDIVGATERAMTLGDGGWGELLTRHHALVRRELARFRGREVDTAGDGFLAAFETPARAIRCARAIRDGVVDLGLAIRAGLHAGECGTVDGKVYGVAVHIGARVAAEAAAGEILVSGTVKELVVGSGLAFEERPARALRGVPGQWRVFAVGEAPAEVA